MTRVSVGMPDNHGADRFVLSAVPEYCRQSIVVAKRTMMFEARSMREFVTFMENLKRMGVDNHIRWVNAGVS